MNVVFPKIKFFISANLSKKEKMEALNEVKVLSSLKHPHIIRYDESFIESGDLCICMEFADRGDLFQLLQTKKFPGLTEDEILDLFVQLASAVAYCHSRKILHRVLFLHLLSLLRNLIVLAFIFQKKKGFENTKCFHKQGWKSEIR